VPGRTKPGKVKPVFTVVNPNTPLKTERMLHKLIADRLLRRAYGFQSKPRENP